MSLLFQDLTRPIIRESLAKVHEELFSARSRQIEEYHDWYMGGENVSGELIRHKGEDDDEWKERRARACNPNFLALLANKLIDGAYGAQVLRSLGNDVAEEQEASFQDWLSWNNMINLQAKVGQGIVVLGDAWVNVKWHPDAEVIGLYDVPPQNVWYSTDPDNPRRIVELVERREDTRLSARTGKTNPYTYYVWNESQAALVDQEGAPIDIADASGRAMPNPYAHGYGRVPYVHFPGRPVVGSTDGLSYIRDLVPIQKLIYNRVSDLDVTITYQAHGVLVIVDYNDVKIETGPKRFIGIKSPTGSASFINPNAPIDKVHQTIMDLVSWMFQTGSVPVSLAVGGTANSGLQLAIEMRPFVQVVSSIRANASSAEVEMVRTMCAVARAHGKAMPYPETLKPEIEFLDNIIPQDQQSEFNRDLAMLNNIPPLMTRADFLKRWHNKLNDDDQIAAYEAELDRDAAEAREYAGSLGSGSVSPGGGGGDVPPGKQLPGDDIGEGEEP